MLVGILDSGVEITNIEIGASVFVNEAESLNFIDDDNNGLIDDLSGWNFYTNNNEIYDNYLHDYHGAFVSSIICGSHEKGSVFGVAPNIKILPLKFMSGSKGSIEDAISAIDYAHDLGASIINCSWDTDKYSEELRVTMAKYGDILFVCTAGKSGNDLYDFPVYPCCYDLPNVIAVAAVDNRGELYSLSGYGLLADVAAPGVDIYGAMPEGDLIFMSGTSYAAAIVSGIAALVKSVDPTLDGTAIAGILRMSSRKIDTLSGKIESGGIIDAYLCLQNASEWGEKNDQ